MQLFRRRSGLVALISASLFAVGAGSAPVASAAVSADGTTTIVSVAADGGALNAPTSTNPSVSANGRYVVFTSAATNAMTGYVHDGGNVEGDVFLRDRVDGTTTLVSAKFGSKTDGGNLISRNPVISGDGKFVAFQSQARNLVENFVDGGLAGDFDVYVRDLAKGTTSLVSVSKTSTPAAPKGGNDDSDRPSISYDGNIIAFSSNASDLFTGFVPGAATRNVFVRDRAAGTTALVSADATNPLKGGDVDTKFFLNEMSVSADGKKVAFDSLDTTLVKNFVKNNTASDTDVYQRDLATATTSLVSGKGGSNASGANGDSSAPSSSMDGRLIAFQSKATDLFTGFVDKNAASANDVFVRDMEAGTFTLVSHSTAAATTGANNESLTPSISGDGRMVAFISTATDFGAGTASAFYDVYVRDVNTDSIVRADTSTEGTLADGASAAPAMSLDGHRVVFSSNSSNLVKTPGPGPQIYNKLLTTPGYWLDASDGGIFAYSLFPPAAFFGSTGAIKLNQPMVGMAPYPDGNGYWLVASDGGIFSFPAPGRTNLFFGSTGAIKLNRPIVGMAAFPNGNGYWLVASDGGIFTFGDSDYYKAPRVLPFFGSAGALPLNKPIVGMAATPTGKGYWLVASDGGIFNYGDAKFYGSTGAIKLNRPIVGMAAFPNGRGYWLVASDGGIFTFGDPTYYSTGTPLPFYGSTGAMTLNKPIVGMASTPIGKGYWLVASDGGIFAYGDAPFFGSTGAITLNQPIVGMAAR